MKKRLAALTTVIPVVLALSGCFPTGEKNPNASTELSDGNYFEYSKDNFTAEFEIPEVSENLPSRIRLKEKKFNTDECLKLFFSSKTILDEKTWEENYWADDGSLLYTNSNSVGFSDGKTANLKNFQIDAPVNYQVALTVAKEYYREIFDIGRELDDFSNRSAIDRALETAAAIGITDLEEPNIYAFSLNSLNILNENEFSFAFNDNYQLTEDNEVYVLRFRQLFDGIELASVDASVKDTVDDTGSFHVDAPEVIIGVSKDDIFFFSADTMYETNFDVLSSEPAKYDLNYALQEFTSYLNKVYFSEETEINELKPVYFPVERNTLGYVEYALAWSFEGTVRQKSGDYLKDDYKIIFLTETGVRMNYKG